MRGALLLLAFTALVIILLVLLSTPPLVVNLNITGNQSINYTLIGGPNDPGTEGTLLSYYYLEKAGYNITTIGPDNASGIVILNPTKCPSIMLANEVEEIAKARGSAFLVISTPSNSCIRNILSALGIKDSPTLVMYNDQAIDEPLYENVLLMISPEGSVWYTGGFYTNPGSGIDVFDSFPEEGPTGLLYINGNVSVLVFGDGLRFSNIAVKRALIYNLTPEGVLDDAVRAAGGRHGDLLYVPSYMYSSRGASGLPHESLVFALNLREYIGKSLIAANYIIMNALSGIQKKPILLLPILLLALPLSLAIGKTFSYITGTKTTIEKVGEPVKIGELRLTRSFQTIARLSRREVKALPRIEAVKLIRALYDLTEISVSKLYGVTIEDAVKPGLFGRYAVDPEKIPDPEIADAIGRLYVIYKRKILGSSLLPRVNLGREALKLYERLLPLFERAELKLRGERGLEYEFFSREREENNK